ncbi:MAG: response regulator transcription factor [Verrucomicrobia bacterium]|nr:response regulator transcription factor [Verrucomicrobiota bacterium]
MTVALAKLNSAKDSSKDLPPLQSHQASTEAKRRIRVLLVDDYPVVRRGISAWLAGHSHLQVVGEAADGVEALVKAKELLPDVVLLDIDLPQMSDLVVAEALRKAIPDIKVIILSLRQRADSLPRILQCGARGYLLKEAQPEELLKAIEMVNAGECYFSPEMTCFALDQVFQEKGVGSNSAELSGREREVLILIARGFGNKGIATELDIGIRTVETHRERIVHKLNIHSVAGLTRFALAEGLVTLQDEVVR